MSLRAIVTTIITALIGATTIVVYAEDTNDDDATLNISLLNDEVNIEIYINETMVGISPLPEQKLNEGHYNISIHPDSTIQPVDFTIGAGSGKKYNIHFGLAPKSIESSIHWPIFFATIGATLGIIGLIIGIGMSNTDWR